MKILLIDNNKHVTKTVSTYLQMSSKEYEIQTAHNGFDAMSKILEFKPTLIILDLSLSGMSGKEIIRKIFKSNSDLKILIASAHRDDMTKNFCLRNGASGYLTKPYSLIDLSNAIHIALLDSIYGKYETIFISEVNENLGIFFDRFFEKNHEFKFQNIVSKKSPHPNRNVSMSNTKHYIPNEILTLKVPSKHHGFITELTGNKSGAIVTVVPDTFLDMLVGFPGSAVGIKGENGVFEFFNILNITIASTISDFLHIHYESSCVRSYDMSKDKEMKDMDLLEFHYVFKLGDKTALITIYLNMNIFKSFKKSDSLFEKI